MKARPTAPERTPEPEGLLERAVSAAVDGVDDSDDIRTRVVDAACEQFGVMGVRRSTMDDVARRAKVSRITVYRRFATKDVLVEQVILREFRRYFESFRTDIRDARTAADRVVLGFVSSLRVIRGNPIIGDLLAAEPEILVGSMIGERGRSVAMVRQFVAGQLRREQAAGHVSTEVDADVVAELMVRISASFLAVPSQIIDLDDDEQLASLARRYLVPMLEPGRN
ncbi:TetR/AcrR family transcriptional regulator [Nocardia callitridis]|uniref:TetR/AcrR family transcriptional regulator n=1 Tax=Nocardia callitridis TaxID=648753 RepID=A0ABP9KLL5_9NOCA